MWEGSKNQLLALEIAYLKRWNHFPLRLNFSTSQVWPVKSWLFLFIFYYLTLSWPRRSKSMDWFLYDNGLRHERVNYFDYFENYYEFLWLVYIVSSKIQWKIFWRLGRVVLKIVDTRTWLTYVMLYAIWYHLYNIKRGKNHGGLLLLVKLPATLLEVTLLHYSFTLL